VWGHEQSALARPGAKEKGGSEFHPDYTTQHDHEQKIIKFSGSTERSEEGGFRALP